MFHVVIRGATTAQGIRSKIQALQAAKAKRGIEETSEAGAGPLKDRVVGANHAAGSQKKVADHRVRESDRLCAASSLTRFRPRQDDYTRSAISGPLNVVAAHREQLARTQNTVEAAADKGCGTEFVE